VPKQDPLPSPRAAIKARFWRIFRLLALLSVIVAALAVVLVTRGEGAIRASLIIATAAGVGFTMLLGSALMTLVFLSASSGHDDEAAPRLHKDKDKDNE
jgi:hypothetical protein